MKKVNISNLSKVILSVFLFITILSLAATYHRYIIMHDFLIDFSATEE